MKNEGMFSSERKIESPIPAVVIENGVVTIYYPPKAITFSQTQVGEKVQVDLKMEFKE